MENTFKKVFDIILAIIVLFIFPLLYYSQRQDTLTQQIVATDTSDFVDTVSTQGYVTRDMYEAFLKRLNATNVVYRIELEHKVLALEPEYKFRSAEEIKAAQDNTGKLNKETNESVLNSAVNTPASADHVHTDECYGGHRHSGGECTFIHHHTHDSSCEAYVSYQSVSAICSSCGKKYERWFYAASWDAARNMAVALPGFTSYSCPYCGSTSYTDLPMVTSIRYSCGYDMDMDGDGYTDKVTDGKEHDYLRSNPQGHTYKAYFGNGLYFDRTLAYICTDRCYTYHQHGILPGNMDSNGTWSFIWQEPWYLLRDYGTKSFCTIPKTYTIRIDWLDAFNVWVCAGIVSFDAVVQPDGSITFTDGYNAFTQADFFNTFSNVASIRYYYSQHPEHSPFNLNGGDTKISYSYYQSIKLCSYDFEGWKLTCGKTESKTLLCNQIVTSITPTHPEQTVAIGDPLITTVKATFLDGSTKVVVANTDFKTDVIVDRQTAALTYTYTVAGVNYFKTCNITVTVVPRTKVCKNGHTYNLNDDGSDPGCPYCAARTPIFTGNVLKYYSSSYSSEIIKELYDGSGTYYFNTGDYFSIKITNKGKTFGTRLYDSIIQNAPAVSINVEEGSTIRNGTTDKR